MTTRAVLYARVPSLAFDSLPQIEGLDRFIVSRGWKISGQFMDIASGDQPRPGWRDLLEAAGRHEFDVVVVWNFLFAKSAAHLLASLERLGALGVRLVSVTERFDSGTDVGKLTAAAMRAFHEFERRRRGERISIGINLRRCRGDRVGRARLALDAEQVRSDYAMLKSIRKTARVHGCSRRTIARILYESKKSPAA